MSNKSVVVLVMSVGEYSKNGTAKYFNKIGAPYGSVKICLPNQYEENAESYKRMGLDVFLYDETKYIPDIDFFGFKPRNCGGVGRQGIAEAVEKFGGDDVICFQIDDDTSGYYVRKLGDDGKLHSSCVDSWDDFVELVNCFDRFYESTGIEMMGATGATPPEVGKKICNRKIFNNFIMRKGVGLNFDGFAEIASDDQFYNFRHNLKDATPMISSASVSITFAQSQGNRNDGNAVMYNGDLSWKKSYALRMMMPWAVSQSIKVENQRVLFRENMETSKLYPPILLSDGQGNITGVGVGKGQV